MYTWFPGEVPVPGLRVQLVALGAFDEEELALGRHGHHVQVQLLAGHRHGRKGNFTWQTCCWDTIGRTVRKFVNVNRKPHRQRCFALDFLRCGKQVTWYLGSSIWWFCGRSITIWLRWIFIAFPVSLDLPCKGGWWSFVWEKGMLGAAKLKGSIWTSHPATLVKFSAIPKNYFWCCQDSLTVLPGGSGQRLIGVDPIHFAQLIVLQKETIASW